MGFSKSGGGMGGCFAPPPSFKFFNPPLSIKTDALPIGHPPPYLKMKSPIWKTNPPLKSVASFQEMIPRKSNK